MTVCRLGRVGYAAAERLQRALVAARREDSIGDQLLLLEHDPVVTLGRGAHDENLRLAPADYERLGIERHEVGRGGDVTYHGPGQLVGYPILALRGRRRDAHRYLRDIEAVLIEAVASFGIEAGRVEGLTGVWVGEEKLAAIGVRLSSGWITSHGFALNVAADLAGFETIVPCGIGDRGVTSIERLRGQAPPPGELEIVVAEAFARGFDRELTWAERPPVEWPPA